MSGWAGRLGVTAIAAAATVAPATASADLPAVRIGELTVPLDAGVRGETVRTAVEVELGRLDAHALRRAKRRLVLSVAVRLDGATCSVNATLRDERRGTMLAILQGSATASSHQSAPPPSVRDAIVRVAVRGAVSQIPDAIR